MRHRVTNMIERSIHQPHGTSAKLEYPIVIIARRLGLNKVHTSVPRKRMRSLC